MAEAQTSRQYLRAALEAGERNFQGLRLGGIDGLDLDLSDCNLEGSCFKEARFGHARLRGGAGATLLLSASVAVGSRSLINASPGILLARSRPFWLPSSGIEL